MNIYESLLSPAFELNDQIARQLFDVLPEQGPIVLIMDRHGNSWPSDSEEFGRLNIHESYLKELCCKIDDGVEPVVTILNDCSVIAAQLATARSNCGYVIIALPQYNRESTLTNLTLIETLLNQFNLIAKLIEKNNLLHEVQIKNHRKRVHDEIAFN